MAPRSDRVPTRIRRGIIWHQADGVTYTYDGYGRRVSVTACAGTRTSLYDLDMHLQSETSLSSGSIAYDYVWFAGLPVAQVDIGGSPHWTVTDYRGAPFMQTTSSGTVYWQADYAPFGAVYSLRTSDVHQPLRLPAQEAEEFTTSRPNGDTGRFYNGFRWYRPLIGRYTQPDPLEYAGQNFSLYAYAQNNPVNYLDPLGLEACGNAFDWGAAAPWLLGAGLLALDIATDGAAVLPELCAAAAAEAGAAEGTAAVVGEAESGTTFAQTLDDALEGSSVEKMNSTIEIYHQDGGYPAAQQAFQNLAGREPISQAWDDPNILTSQIPEEEGGGTLSLRPSSGGGPMSGQGPATIQINQAGSTAVPIKIRYGNW